LNVEEKIKKIIAVFLQKEPSEISSSTLINTSVIPGSILIHRMYRELSLAGFPIENYTAINTYGELLNRLNGSPIEPEKLSQVINIMPISAADKSGSGMEIGIDIENITNFPNVNDYREDPFYKTHFTANEISYCILKPVPIESFAGLFCLKEAICKTNEAFRKISFNQIEITHTPEGKPIYPGYGLSVSHTKEVATGVAIIKGSLKEGFTTSPNIEPIKEVTTTTATMPNKSKSTKWIAILALLLAIATLIIEIVR